MLVEYKSERERESTSKSNEKSKIFLENFAITQVFDH